MAVRLDSLVVAGDHRTIDLICEMAEKAVFTAVEAEAAAPACGIAT